VLDFKCFTSRRLLWVIKEHGQSWDGAYFREHIIKKRLIPFLKKRKNRQSRFGEITYLHDMAGSMKVRAKHRLLDEFGLKFFRGYGHGRWPGNSADINPAENIGAIVKDRGEKILDNPECENRNSRETLINVLTNVLSDMEEDTELFCKLLRSFKHRMELLRQVGGKRIKKY